MRRAQGGTWLLRPSRGGKQLPRLAEGQPQLGRARSPRTWAPGWPRGHADRSEEHTSELQSLAYLVCRLLLEKKKRQCIGDGRRQRLLAVVDVPDRPDVHIRLRLLTLLLRPCFPYIPEISSRGLLNAIQPSLH